MSQQFPARLRAASDGLLATIDELRRLEDEKRSAEPGSSLFTALATEIERLSEQALQGAAAQQGLAVEAELRQAAGQPMPTIEDTLRPASVVLDEWRSAERRLAGLEPSDEAYERVQDEVQRLKSEYLRVFEATRSESSGQGA